jgi:hypothetical protein
MPTTAIRGDFTISASAYARQRFTSELCGKHLKCHSDHKKDHIDLLLNKSIRTPTEVRPGATTICEIHFNESIGSSSCSAYFARQFPAGDFILVWR